MHPEKLAMMANQIGAFFKAQGEMAAPAAIADHLKKFWDPGMRADIIALLGRSEPHLDHIVRQGVELLQAEKT